MPWANPSAPNLPDFYLFVQNEMQVPSSALPAPTITSAPAAPSLTAGTGGSLPAGAVYVRVTYVSAFGETGASAEASVTVGANGSVTVSSPPVAAFATGFNVYAAGASGGEVLQTPSPIAIGTPFVLNAFGTSNATPPTVNTTGWTWPLYAFGRASALVLQVPGVSGIELTLATYNCAGHCLLGTAPDQSGQNFFSAARSNFDMNEPSSGVLSSSSDQGTSNSMHVPESLQKLTVGDLWFFTTPYGRAYLAYAQDFGEIAGLS